MYEILSSLVNVKQNLINFLFAQIKILVFNFAKIIFLLSSMPLSLISIFPFSLFSSFPPYKFYFLSLYLCSYIPLSSSSTTYSFSSSSFSFTFLLLCLFSSIPLFLCNIYKNTVEEN